MEIVMNHKNGLNISTFENFGFIGLYGGLHTKDIFVRKGIIPNQSILDSMGYTELAANLFRITQTNEKLTRENIQDEDGAKQAYFLVGQKVRQAITELGGIRPEDLPFSGKKRIKYRNQKWL